MRARLLVDAELVLFALAAPARLSRETRELIDASEAYVSAASILEIGLKSAAGSLCGEVLAALEPSGFRTLPVSAEHAAFAAALEDPPADPLDRLLIAQASLEGMVLLTSDAALAAPPRKAARTHRRRPRPSGARVRAVRTGRRAKAELPPARCRIVLAGAPAAARRPRS